MQSVFVGSTVKGCFFHFSQCVFKRIKKVGLAIAYNILSFACRTILRRLFYIPFLPVEEMVDAFEQIADESKWSEVEGILLPEHIAKIRQVMTYFRKTWIAGTRLERFNVWSVTVRTNNKAEAFNNVLNKQIKPHPNVYALVRFLGEDQNINTEIGIMQAAKGAKVCKQRRIYRVRDELIEKAKELLRKEVNTPLEYIDRISLVYDQKRRERLLCDSGPKARNNQQAGQIPVATPMPAAVRRKGHLSQYHRLSVPRQKICAQPPPQHLLTGSHQKCTRKRPANKSAVGEPTKKKVKVDVRFPTPNPEKNTTVDANGPVTKQNGYKRKSFQRHPNNVAAAGRRTFFLTPYAMPDTLIAATPVWLQHKRRIAKTKELQLGVVQSSKILKSVKAKQPERKITLQEAV